VSSDNFYPGHTVLGTFLLNGGMLSARDISVSGAYSQGGGTNHVTGDLTITGDQYSRYELTGGSLLTSNTFMRDGDGNFIQTGGRHRFPTRCVWPGGRTCLRVGRRTSDCSHNRNHVWHILSPGWHCDQHNLLRLSGWWDEFVGNQQFGQLQIGTNFGSLWLGTNSAILRFANSSGQTWAAEFFTSATGRGR